MCGGGGSYSPPPPPPPPPEPPKPMQSPEAPGKASEGANGQVPTGAVNKRGRNALKIDLTGGGSSAKTTGLAIPQ